MPAHQIILRLLRTENEIAWLHKRSDEHLVTVYISPYRVEWDERKVLRKITDYLKSCDNARGNEFEYSTPVLLLKNKDIEWLSITDT